MIKALFFVIVEEARPKNYVTRSVDFWSAEREKYI